MPIEGTFVTIDGPEGAGKSFLSRILIERLNDLGVSTVHTKEPGGTPLGLEYRRRLLDPDVELTIDEELELFFLDRQEHFATVIEPALADGKFVISDRCSPSTFAYQHFGRDIPLNKIVEPDRKARRGRVPNYSLIVDVPVSIGMARVDSRGEKKTTFEREKREFHDRIRTGFLQMSNNPDILPDWNIQIISGDRPKDDVIETTWKLFREQFPYIDV